MFPVILCGGSGSRLWPLSRENHPKPFIKSKAGLSFLQNTFSLASKLPNVTEITLAANRDYYFNIKDDIEGLGKQNLPYGIISEPEGRDTLAAIAIAAYHIAQKHGDDAILLIMPSDHIISKEENFKKAIDEASLMAEQGKIVTFGITPTHAETGYGYIHANGNCVEQFIEKPNYQKAKSFIEKDNYLWNSGMFCFSARTFLNELRHLKPIFLKDLKNCYQVSNLSQSDKYFHLELNPDKFRSLEKVSIDYSIMEKATQAAVVPCDLGWKDIGDWKTFEKLMECDKNNNRLPSDAISLETSDCSVLTQNKFVAAIGVKNLIVVDQPDALLILNKDHSQEVKTVYQKLKENGLPQYKEHHTVHRPWGIYTILQNGLGYKIKKIYVKPKSHLSLQFHRHRSEHWVVVSGRAKVQKDDDEFFLNINESTFISPGETHRLSNPENTPLEIIEIQCGDYLEEDDIVRLDDHYGRATSKAIKIDEFEE